MSSIAMLIYILLQKYLVPALFTIGLFYFFYGIIEYFIIGKGGDESRAEHGRILLLKSIGWFVVALLAHLVVVIFGWLMTLDISSSLQGPNVDSGVNVEREREVLEVPDVPRR